MKTVKSSQTAGSPVNATVSVNKILYVDNLKILLTVLVVIHHAAVTYGAPGGWYYAEKSSQLAALLPMAMLVAINQSFFMGFFFLISAYFTPTSYNKKGTSKFIADRLKRLGIPLVFYSFIFSPVLNYLVYRFAHGHQVTFLQFLGGYDDWIDFGVLWFVAALLLFNLAYAGVRLITKNTPTTINPAPNAFAIIIFATALGIISYLVRMEFPVGRTIPGLGFQLGHFTQYVGLFTVGIIASNGKWLQNPDYKMAKVFRILVVVMIVVGFPVVYYIKIATNCPLDFFNGNGHIQSLAYAFWEQLTGIFIIAALVCLASRKWNSQSNFSSGLSRAAFGVYIFHPLVLISLSISLIHWGADPGIKFLVVAPLAVAGSFLLSTLILKIPFVNKII